METLVMGIAIGIAIVVILIMSIIGFVIDAVEYLLGCGVLLVTAILVVGYVLATTW